MHTKPEQQRRSYPYVWTAITVAVTAGLLSAVQLAVSPPLLLGERLLSGGGWVQIALAAVLAGGLYLLMHDRKKRSLWRRRAWMFFAIVFFLQLLLGIAVDSFFLLNDKLHFPIPGIIPAGAVYRWQIGFMPLLFLITVFLSGGSWCSQLCYFGAFDSAAAGNGKSRSEVKPVSTRTRHRIRFSVLTLFIGTALLLRLSGANSLWATGIAATAGIAGVLIVSFLSPRSGKMIHCSACCPLGTITSYLKYISFWRFRMNKNCTRCMACTSACRYGALASENINKGKPAVWCTQCGDCLGRCKHDALEYRFMNRPPKFSENLWLCVNVTLYAVFLTIARI